MMTSPSESSCTRSRTSWTCRTARGDGWTTLDGVRAVHGGDEVFEGREKKKDLFGG